MTPPKRTEPVPIAPSEPASNLAAVTLQTLQEVDRADTPLGAIALQLAQMLGAGDHPASGAAALSKELRATLAEALAGAEAAADSLDELAKRRHKKAAGA